VGDKPLEKTSNETEKGITLVTGSAAIQAANRRLRDEQNRLAVMKATIELLMGNIRNQIGDMRKQIAYTSKILKLLETFMGVYEDIIPIKEGEKAPIDTPITIRQLILYADEEVADISSYEGQIGLDYRRLTEFDQWVAVNYTRLVPEEKCVVAIKPSRQSRDYGNIFANTDADKANKMVYLLIRNGECLYRVYTDLYMADKLFPSSEEMERVNKMLMSEHEYEREVKGFSIYTKDKAKDDDLYWKQNAVLLQGLIIRTDILQPTPFPLSLFENQSYETGMLVLIRDAEPTLTDGRLSFKEWREQLNRKITLGTRVVMGYYDGYKASEYAHYHFSYKYYNSPPPLPKRGIYVIDEAHHKVEEWDSPEYAEGLGLRETGKKIHHVKHKTKMRFLYTPHDEIWAIGDDGYMDTRKRKKRVAFYFSTDDGFFMNYDDVTLEDVSYYLSNRLERPNYLSIMPMLVEIRDERQREKQFEEPLVKMIAAEFNCDESIVWDCIHWWKMKTQLHRWVDSDDQKAWRMIRRRVNRIVNNEIGEDDNEL